MPLRPSCRPVFRSGPEARSLGGALVRLWLVGLARRPHAAELAAGAARLRAGDDVGDIAAWLAGGEEFVSRHGPDGPPDRHYLRALFWAIDGRDRPEAECDRLLRTGRGTRASLLAIVSQSAEACRAISVEAGLYPGGLPPGDDVAYQLWLARGQPPPQQGGVSCVSVFVAVAPVRPDLLRETVASLQAQHSPRWEALLVRGRGCDAAEALAAADGRVRLVDAADASLAAGELVGFVEAGDRLAPELCGAAGGLLAARPDLRLIYTDEDCIGGDGTRSGVRLKPGWGLDMLLAGDAVGQLALYRRAAAGRLGDGPHARFEMSLRVTADAPSGAVAHLPGVLFHRGRARTGRPLPYPQMRASNGDAALDALVDAHLARHRPGLRRGQRRAGLQMWPTLAAALPVPAPRVSVIMPTRDGAALLEASTAGLLEGTDYPDIELLLVDNGSAQPAALSLLTRLSADRRVRVLRAPGPFNWSALNNLGAAEATGEVLLLLNNDVSMPDPGWLARLAAQAMRPDVGVAGARLLFPDGTLQHGGVLLGPRGNAVHAMTGAAGDDPWQGGGYGGLVAVLRDVSAVTGACLAIRRSVFREVGGLEAAALRVAWSDIELCLRVRDAGYRVVWDPAVMLVHHEMATRGRDVSLAQQARHEAERAWVRARWPEWTERDPFLNPALRADAAGVVLAQPDAAVLQAAA